LNVGISSTEIASKTNLKSLEQSLSVVSASVILKNCQMKASKKLLKMQKINVAHFIALMNCWICYLWAIICKVWSHLLNEIN
jgi:hypothetical protein